MGQDAMIMPPERLPIRLTAGRDPKTGVERARWEPGKAVAKAQISIGAKPRIALSKKAGEDSVRTLKILAAAVKSAAGSRKSALTVDVEIVRNHCTLVGATVDAGRSAPAALQADRDLAAHGDEVGGESLEKLVTLGAAYALARIGGQERRPALHTLLDTYLDLSPEDRAGILETLGADWVDPHGSLATFLRSVTDPEVAHEIEGTECEPLDRVPTATLMEWIRGMAPGGNPVRLLPRIERLLLGQVSTEANEARLRELLTGAREKDGARAIERLCAFFEATVRWRDRWVAWYLGQCRFDLPYDGKRVIDLLETTCEDVDEKRALVNVAVSETFTPDLEGENIDRISTWALENDVRLVAGRLSRAFGNQAHLLSAAKTVADRSDLRKLCGNLKKASSDLPELSSQVTRISLLAGSPEPVPMAQILGAVDLAEEALVDHMRMAGRRAVSEKSSRIQSGMLAGLARDDDPAAELSRKADGIRTILNDLRSALMKAEKRDAAYVVFLQRFHPAETIGLANANACRDVHPGKEQDLRDLTRLGGHNFYSSPGQGRVEAGGRTRSVHWISRVGDWIEAIPLFIKESVVTRTGEDGEEIQSIETAVDQEAMEAFFRAHAEYWGLNIEEVMDTEHAAIARKAVAELLKGSKIPDAEAVRVRAETDGKLAKAVAAVAAAVALDSSERVSDVNRRMEQDGTPRIEILEEILRSDETSRLAALLADGKDTSDGITRRAGNVSTRQGDTARAGTLTERLLPLVSLKTRPLPALHILTTESAGMTEGYVQSWLEEEMSLWNVIRGEGLEKDVDERVNQYREKIQSVGRKVIEELGMDVVVQEVMAEQKIDEPAAVLNVIFSYRPVAEEVARLAVLIDEYAARRRRQGERIQDPAAVEAYLKAHRSSLEREAVPRVVANNGRAIQEKIDEYLRQHPKVGRAVSERRVVEDEPDYRSEWKSLMRSMARQAVLHRLDEERPERGVLSRVRSYLRTHTQLAPSTARKAILAEKGLQDLTLDPRYVYQAAGGNKRYHLLYTPSRVNLGERERDSVAKWRQWVGGADDAAARHGLRFYSFINEGGVEERPALPHAEIQKTSENALCVTHFAGSNGLALLINSVREGDVEDMADQMNLREDRMVPPAGEGYGGYCVPKDGLFLAFVLSLQNDVKLRQMGIPDHLHEGVMTLAREAIAKRNQFETRLDWQLWAAEHLVQAKALQRFFRVKGGIPVFQVTKVARTIQNLGEPWKEVADGPTLLANLSAQWGVEHMIIHAEQVNRFMTFYKAWMIYQALAEARRDDSAVAADQRAKVALSAEYKPVQDVRFSTGMRLFEMLARTGDHLVNCFDEEGQNLVTLMLNGFDPESEDHLVQRASRSAASHYGVFLDDRDASARLGKAFPRHAPPADIIMTSVTMSSTRDMLFYTSDTRLDQIADRVQVQLNDLGLTQEQIEANAKVHGGNLRRWAGLRDLPADELDAVVAGIGGDIHALVLKLRGPGRDYQKDIQGVDVLNTGIPFPELLDLLQDPPKVVFLMQTGNPHSALAITDGAAGRAHRSLTERDVMAFFAACEKAGRRGVYRAVGLGTRNVERLRNEMHRQRGRAKELLDALDAVVSAKGNARKAAVRRAREVFGRITASIRETEEPLRALRQEERVRRSKKWRPRDGFISRALAAVGEGLSLESLTPATWLAGFGGWFLTMGEEKDRIDAMLDTIRAAARHVASGEEGRPAAKKVKPPFDGSEENTVLRTLVRPKYVPEIQGFVQEMLVETSSKAVEVAAIEALERRKALRARAVRAQAVTERENGFRSAYDDARGKGFDTCARSAGKNLDVIERNSRKIDGTRSAEETAKLREDANRAFGAFLATTRAALEALAKDIFRKHDQERFRTRFLEDCAEIFTGREIVLEDWKRLAGGYEDIGGIARVAEAAKHDRKILDRVAVGVELFYTTFCLGQTLEFALEKSDEVDRNLFWKRVTDFFAETINDHFHPYTPWAFARGSGFMRYSEEELYQLSVRRHEWLYRYLRWLLTTKSELRDLTEEEQDHLLGNYLDGKKVTGIAADAGTEVERKWRAYNQLREAAFIRSDGFRMPPVFPEFDPDLIDAENRTNLLFLYPVGRTHISRAFREGPTLNREFTTDDRKGVNILVSRHGEFGPVEGAAAEGLWVRSAHLYLSEEGYIEALMRHRGLSKRQANKAAADERKSGRLTDKGIRVAVRFVRNGKPSPVLAGSVVPFHGHPLYESGSLEDHGIPATSQSLIYTDITYDKSLYPEIYDGKSGVELPAEIDWKAARSAALSEKAAKNEIENGSKVGFPGLRKFADGHPIILIKGAAESGARNLKVFDVKVDGTINEEELENAVNFVYDVSRRQNVVIQEALLTSPEFWADEDLMRAFVNRQILEWNRPVERNRYPRSQIYGSMRIIAASSHPDRDYDLAFPITLSSLQVATNVGRGGTLEILLPEYVQEDHRDAILEGLRDQAPKVMRACARYAKKYEKTFELVRGRKAGKDLRGVSYGWPPYLMLDFLASPVFEKPGRLVDIEPRYDGKGNRIGSRAILEGSGGRFEGRISGWRFIHLEPNIGIGLWDRYNLREEIHERRAAEKEGRAFDWYKIGQSDRIVLRTFLEAGEEYLQALKNGGR